MFGPGRSFLNNCGYEVLDSGYCRLSNSDQEKQIESRIERLSFTVLKSQSVQIESEQLAFMLSTCAAEQIFEQSKIDFILYQ